MSTPNMMNSETNLEDWMGQLEPPLKNVSICYLAIPGSHDSLSFSITPASILSPDAPYIAKLFNKLCGPVMRRITYNWCVTQNASIEKQFRLGIRYFDLRIATKGSELYSCHAMYGMNIIDALQILNRILDIHSEEVVILDFQHFYKLVYSDHSYLISQIYFIFGNKLCAYHENVTELTLGKLQKEGKQVIVVYRTKWAIKIPDFWPSPRWVTLWPNTTDIMTLYDYLIRTLPKRPKNAGFVSQCVFTPSSKFVTYHLFSSLKNACSINCNMKIKSIWVQNQKCLTAKGVNVIIADFIDLPNFEFSSTVIDLNKKSLSNANN